MKPEDGKCQHTKEGLEGFSRLSSATENRSGAEAAPGTDPLVNAICQALDREEGNQEPSAARKLAMARREALAGRSPATGYIPWNGLLPAGWRLVPACAAAGLVAVLLWGQPVGLQTMLTGKSAPNRPDAAVTGSNTAAQARKSQTPGVQQANTAQSTAAGGVLTALEGADIDMLAAEEQMDLVGQLDFYQWLAGGGEDAV